MRNIRKHSHINEEYLIKEYINNQRSAFDIANENGVRAKFIIGRLKRFNIPTRSILEANSSKISNEKRKSTCIRKYGVENVSKTECVIQKIKNNTDRILQGKRTSESLKKRTAEEWIESYRKRVITFLQRYGCENISQLPETKRKMRLSAIERINNQLIDGGQIYPSFNRNACQLIEEYGQQNGYNFQHAMNGGEYFISHLGYWVDGYDKMKNVVIEVDEAHHYDKNGLLRERDVYRQREIEKYLGCKFIRIKSNE